MMCTVCSAEDDEIKGATITSYATRLGRPGPGPALGASGRVTIELEEHGGYFCAGCKLSWTSLSLVSLNHHRASPYMRRTECEEENNLNLNLNSRELRNNFQVRANLASATGQYSRPRFEYWDKI